MRFLLTTVPGAGHLFPLVPLAWSLRALGHEILLATAGPGTVFGPGAGLTTVDVAPGLEVEAIASTLHDSGESEHGDSLVNGRSRCSRRSATRCWTARGGARSSGHRTS